MSAERKDQLTGEGGVDGLMLAIGRRAGKAAAILANAPSASKDAALRGAAAAIRARSAKVLEANSQDVLALRAGRASAAMLDRGTLSEARIEAIAQSLEDVSELNDPIGSVIAEWDRPNGLRIQRVRTPLGVVGVIFESRPNVTADAGGLCLKAAMP